ncbi:MAG: hypothetical protein KKD05_07970 [Candidatus Omnitrophica bacterium]|nr:hypothetical protein [Candidatus Omnitrophota bacterium]
MRLSTRIIKNCWITVFFGFVFTANVFAGLTEAERYEMEKLQVLVEKNAEMSQGQMQRWEELILKDPDNLRKIRQKEIEKWKDAQRAEGKEIDQVGIERKLETEWNDFLLEKNKKIINLNEQNVVLFLKQIRDACRIENQNKQTYPQDLNTLILNSQANIEPEFYAKIKKIYNIRYKKTVENYQVLAFPLNPGQSGNKNFLLDSENIFFTIDGSLPTLNSHKIL